MTHTTPPQNGLKDLKESDFLQCPDPEDLFRDWFCDAERAELNDPNAMALATVDALGFPQVRIVLMKDFSDQGIIRFFTNRQSQKGDDLLRCDQVSVNFYWKSLGRQVRIVGRAHPISDIQSDAYFATRPRENQIGAWASQQSRPLLDRPQFDARLESFVQRFDGQDVPRPPHWGGYDIVPLSFEFWAAHPSRWHERVVFSRSHHDAAWERMLLYP